MRCDQSRSIGASSRRMAQRVRRPFPFPAGPLDRIRHKGFVRSRPAKCSRVEARIEEEAKRAVYFLRRLAVLLSGWIDDVSLAVVSISAVIRPARKFRLVEREDLAFSVEPARERSARSAAAAQVRFVDGRAPRTPARKLRRDSQAGKSNLSSPGADLCSEAWSCRNRRPTFSTPSFDRKLTG